MPRITYRMAEAAAYPLTKKMLEAKVVEGQINRLQQSLDHLKERRTRITSSWHDVKVQNSLGQGFADITDEISEIDEKISEYRKQYAALILEIDIHPDANLLKDYEFMALKCLFLYGMTIKNTALKLHSSEMTINRWKRTAINKLREEAQKNERE